MECLEIYTLRSNCTRKVVNVLHGDVSEFMFAVFTMRGRVVDCAVEEMVSVVSYLRIGISLSRDSVLGFRV